MNFTPTQKATLESALSELESGVARLTSVIEEFDEKRAEFVVQRDDALKMIALMRSKLGIRTIVQ